MSQNQLPNCQHGQNSGNPYPMGQQAPCGQNYFGQPAMQQDPFAYNHQQKNPCPCIPTPTNSCPCPPQSGQQPQTISCNGLLPQNVIEQIRTCVGNTATPIFILPSGNNPAQQYQPQVSQVPTQVPMNQGFPSSMGYPNPSANIFPSPCYPCPFVLPLYEPFLSQNRQRFEGSSGNSCNCCGMRNGGNNSSSPLARGGYHGSIEDNEHGHRCSPGSDDTVCTKPNCPSSINLQALASQLLSLQGVIPCAATRLILKKVSGSNVTTSVEETMERAQKSIAVMNRDQLIAESRNAQQVNGLINLHMVSKPPANIVPVLTMLQLKMNSLKALVENLVNKSIVECHGFGAEANCSLEKMLLTTKSDAELRELLGTLRQRECEERVNLNYAPYHSQRVVAEGRLANFQSKIGQVETEMERRRAAAMPWADNLADGKFSGSRYCGENFNQGFDFQSTRGFNPTFNASQLNDAAAASAGFESPSPFTVQVRNPKRLNLKPNAGYSQTIYDGERNTASPEAFAVRKLEEEEKTGKEKADLETDTAESRSKIKEEDAGGKKKFRIHVVDTRGDLSVSKRSMENLESRESLKSSPADIAIVIEKGQESGEGRKASEKRSWTRVKSKNKNGGKNRRKKSPSSIKSDSSTQGSEVSMSSSAGAAEEEEREGEGEEAKEQGHDSRSSTERRDKDSKLWKNIRKSDKKKTTRKKGEDEPDVPEIENRNGGKKNKKDKHVNVAMITELRYDDFNSPEKFRNRGSGSILHSDEPFPGNDYSEDCSQSSLVEGDCDDDRDQYCDDDGDDDDDDRRPKRTEAAKKSVVKNYRSKK